MTVTAYARWDEVDGVKYLYMCYVVEGINPFYFNDYTYWYGNSVQVAFAPDNREQNWSLQANDKDGDGKYDAGYVGNEYCLAIGSGGAKGAVGLSLIHI